MYSFFHIYFIASNMELQTRTEFRISWFLQYHKFCFFWVNFHHHFSHHSCNWLRQFCRPDLDFDIIARSSAYNKLFNVVSFGSTSGSDKVCLKSPGISLI